MDLSILNGWLVLVASGCGVVVWWMFRSLHARVEKSELDLSLFKLDCAKTYVTSDRLEKAIDNLNATISAVFAKLERIEDKLDLKADK